MQRYLTLAALVAVAACAGGEPPPARGGGPPSGAATDQRPVVLFLGTSLTAGLGVEPGQAYPALIQHRIDSAGLGFRVVNAGVSGETSADARARIEWLLQMNPAVLVVETGANDGLRGLDVPALEANLDTILATAQHHEPPPRLVVVGMEAPPNLGARYTAAFRAVYPQEAARHAAALVPFLLQGVGGIDSLNQRDGIHPTPAGHRVLAGTVWAVLAPLLQSYRESTVAAESTPRQTAPPAAGRSAGR